MYPIIALWCHPRSMSTALERLMRERGDCRCFHEPFMFDYYIHRAVRTMPHFEPEPGHPTSYADIREMLLSAAEEGPVFFKDMSYYVVPVLFEDRAFARRLVHTFLVRDPAKSILSYHKLDPELTSEEVGIAAQREHAEWLESALGRKPIVLEAEAVQRDTQGIIAAYWEAVGLDFRGEAFSWDKERLPEEWEQVSTWHGKASKTGEICALTPEEEARRRADFAAAAEKDPKLLRFLDDHRPAYDWLRERALSAV